MPAKALAHVIGCPTDHDWHGEAPDPHDAQCKEQPGGLACQRLQRLRRFGDRSSSSTGCSYSSSSCAALGGSAAPSDSGGAARAEADRASAAKACLQPGHCTLVPSSSSLTCKACRHCGQETTVLMAKKRTSRPVRVMVNRVSCSVSLLAMSRELKQPEQFALPASLPQRESRHAAIRSPFLFGGNPPRFARRPTFPVVGTGNKE